MGSETSSFYLMRDHKGMMWDLLLYIPTVTILASVGFKFWYGGNHDLAYLLLFLASFFLIAGVNRIFKTRLMLLPSAPVCLSMNSEHIRLTQRDGKAVDLVKEQRFYPDYSGRSFGISGLDGSGKRLQFVFHKGQFSSSSHYEKAIEALKRHFN